MGKCKDFMDSHNWEVCCSFPSEFKPCKKKRRKRRSPEFGPGPVIPEFPNDGAFFFRNNSGVISVLSRLTPGTALSSVIIDGTVVPVTSFVSFNRQTGIATFEGADGTLVLANARQIDAITFPAATTV
ncbi:hypothetical protein IEO70_15030 [Bacillus sp. AGMB 02131]|uniref:Uncharacterized protein n=1 Tax=Peribacillus faecalis TaxID=2772559 RepID=A0A927D161_9BACI|nr:hypothetical protein [Peribacillus faecalis]MBD3109660.1 hypothetical protein [Peribacillus faecalis]